MKENYYYCPKCERGLGDYDIHYKKKGESYVPKCIYCNSDIIEAKDSDIVMLKEALDILKGKVFLLKNHNLVFQDTYLTNEEYSKLQKVLDIYKAKEKEDVLL